MKKLSIMAVTAITAAAAFTGCGNSAPKADMKSDIDSLSYAFGVEQSQGVKMYLQQMEIDTTYMDEFVKGITTGAKGADDKKKAAYNARSEEHTSELQSHVSISYAVFCLKKKFF